MRMSEPVINLVLKVVKKLLEEGESKETVKVFIAYMYKNGIIPPAVPTKADAELVKEKLKEHGLDGEVDEEVFLVLTTVAAGAREALLAGSIRKVSAS